MENNEEKPTDIQVEEEKHRNMQLKDPYFQAKIRSMYLDGVLCKDIRERLNINTNTWDSAYWRNTHGFRDFMLEVKKEYMLKQTETVSDKIMKFDTNNLSDKKLAIQQKEAEFLRETLGKDQGYSKRIETIGLNLNKTEPLDENQKANLDRLFKTKNVEYKVTNDSNTDLSQTNCPTEN